MNSFVAHMISVALSVLGLASTTAASPEFLNGLPCKMQFNQLYCEQQGFSYPMDRINGYIDDNKNLMRRMYGSLVQDPKPPPAPTKRPKTPASTTFVRSVRQFDFGGARFSRSVEEGFLEDLLLEEEEYDWNHLDANFSSIHDKPNSSDEDEPIVLHFGAGEGHPKFGGSRGKRQAGFPGAPSHKNDKSRLDACESRTEVTTPYWATNQNGVVRAVVNTKHFQQAVHQEICTASATLRCAGDCKCEQKYKWHRLLAYDPNNDCNGIFMDWFLFPSCCACRCARNPLLSK